MGGTHAQKTAARQRPPMAISSMQHKAIPPEEAPPTDSVIRPDDTPPSLWNPPPPPPVTPLADSDATQEITLFVRVRADDFIAAYLDPQSRRREVSTETYPDFSPFLYAFDVFVPLLDFGSETLLAGQ